MTLDDDRARLAFIRDANATGPTPMQFRDLLRMAEDGIAAREEAERALAALRAVEALHVEGNPFYVQRRCFECRQTWPCPTRAVIAEHYPDEVPT